MPDIPEELANVPHYRRVHLEDDWYVWVVCGPIEVVKPGAKVEVRRRDGRTKTEKIACVGPAFYVGNTKCRYGYLRYLYRQYGRPRTIVANRKCPVSGENCVSTDGSEYCVECGEYISPYERQSEQYNE
jgi:hypothetical protein